MADKKISALTGATTPLAGTEVLPIVQSGSTVKVAVSDLTAGRAVSALTLNSTTDATFATTSGSVGIGTASPAKKLQINSSDTTDGIRLYCSDTGGENLSIVWQSAFGSNRITGDIKSNASGTGGDFTIRVADTSAALQNRFRINNAGIVAMAVYGAGAATFDGSGVISSVSDETWKIKDGVPTNPDAMLQKLEPGYWFYNDEKKETFGSNRQLGFYAQNVNAAIGPEAAPVPEKHKDEEGNDTDVSKPWGYYDRSVLAITVMSLKKALAAIETLEAKVAALEARTI
jgi:hypothetical protein